jgi:hypothetical protein
MSSLVDPDAHDLLHGNYDGFGPAPSRNQPICRGFPGSATGARRSRMARMCSDMRRFGTFLPEVPEIAKTGFNHLPQF